MEVIRIRLTESQKEKLKDIADRDNRSITGVIRNWIECDNRSPQAQELFGNKDYLRKSM